MSIQLASDFQEAFEKFIDSLWRNRCLSTSQLKVYVRKSKRVVRNQVIPVLDIGDIDVAEKLRGQGLFTQVLDVMKSFCGDEFKGVMVENVLNPDLQKHLCGLAKSDPDHCVWDDELQRFFWLTTAKSCETIISL